MSLRIQSDLICVCRYVFRKRSDYLLFSCQRTKTLIVVVVVLVTALNEMKEWWKKRDRERMSPSFLSFAFSSHSIPVFILHVGVFRHCILLSDVRHKCHPSNAWTRWRTTIELIRLNGIFVLHGQRSSNWTVSNDFERIEYSTFVLLRHSKGRRIFRRLVVFSFYQLSNLSLICMNVDKRHTRYVYWQHVRVDISEIIYLFFFLNEKRIDLNFDSVLVLEEFYVAEGWFVRIVFLREILSWHFRTS